MTASLCYEALDSVFHCPLLKPLLYQDRIWFKLKFRTRNFFQVPIFSTRKTKFQLAFCEFASVSFEPWRVRWGLTSCQVLSKSIQQLQRRSRKMFQPIRSYGGHLGFLIGTKHKLGRVCWGLASCQILSKSIQRLRRRSRKMFQPISSQGGHRGLLIGTKNTNFFCLCVCLEKKCFQNFWTARDRDFIVGMHTELMKPYEMAQGQLTWQWPAENSHFELCCCWWGDGYSCFTNILHVLPLGTKCVHAFQFNIIIPPATKLGGGILESPCPSVRLSVRLSVDARLGKMVSRA